MNTIRVAKDWLTQMFPAFHARNFVSGAYYNWMKADAVAGKSVESVRIEIDGTLDSYGQQGVPEAVWMQKAQRILGEDADRIVDALTHSLPQGTLDRVLVKLMERKASVFRVPMSFAGDDDD